MKILHNSIGIWDNVVSQNWCDEVMLRFDEKVAAAEGVTDDDDYNGIMFRNNRKRIDVSLEMGNFESMHWYEEALKQKLEECLDEYAREITGTSGSMWSECEVVQCKLQRTPPKGGFCQVHYEQGNDIHCSRRFAVWILYLNDLDISSGTDFLNHNMTVQPKAGRLAIWPAAYTHPHRSSPLIEEQKYICTGWFVYHCDEFPSEVSRT